MLEEIKFGLLVSVLLVALPGGATGEEDASSEASEGSVSIGTDPGQAKVAGSSSSDGAPPLTIRTSTQDWELGFHGYLRAPLRISFDTRQHLTYPTVNGVPNTGAEPDVGEDVRFNMAPALPDTVYTDWKYTSNLSGPWAEMVFSYGNAIAVGNVSVATYNITDSGWRNLQSQLGIDQAWVTLNFPRAFGGLGGLTWNVGVFGNRYGNAGRYDAGRYDTYLIGRTHVAGETLTAKLDLRPNLTLILEHGFGAKTDILPGNPKGIMDPGGDYAVEFGWVPYPGEDGVYPAMVNHAHAGVVFHTHKLFKELLINGHFLHGFTRSADPTNDLSQWPYREKNGKMVIFGVELKINGAVFGDGYLGFSTVETDGLNRMPDAIEMIHSQGGWAMLKNFYGNNILRVNPDDPTSTRSPPSNPGTGRINSLAWQYMFSLSRMLWYLEGKEYWGQGPDLAITTWGMLNLVNPDDSIEPYLEKFAKKKLKLGAELMYTPFQYMGLGFRYDRVIPDLDYDPNDVSYTQETSNLSSYAPFHTLGPKLQFRTAFITHEEVNVQYLRYFWKGDREEVKAENPHENLPADRNGLMISVNMWW